MLTIDGAQGEGGGQVLRTSLALSLVTGEPFRMVNVRARRSRPGLMRQHLTALQAAATVSQAEVSGDVVGSTEITFRPGKSRGGDYAFSVGTAGSATLVLQTVLPALMLASEPSNLVLEGGTHNPQSPPFDFLARAFLPLIRRMGPRVEVALERPGFYPAGGGRFRVSIDPERPLRRIDLLERGEIRSRFARAVVASLPKAIADRELRVISERLGWQREELRSESMSNAHGPGNVVMVEIESANINEVFTSFGERGVPAEAVAEKVARETAEYVESGAPVGTHLADQLLLAFALAGGGSFRTLIPSQHTHTQADVIGRFLCCETRMEAIDDKVWEIEVAPERRNS
jgi:RNA 3'-terminal phosphate cyclase (ATP)